MNPFIQNRIDTIYNSNPSIPAWRASFYWLASGTSPEGVDELMAHMDGPTALTTGHVCEAVSVAYAKLAEASLQLPLQADEFQAVYGSKYSMPLDVSVHASQRVMRDHREELSVAYHAVADKLFRKAAEAGEFTATFVELPAEYQGVARRASRKALDRLAPKTAMAQHVFGPMRPLVGEGSSEDYSGRPST